MRRLALIFPTAMAALTLASPALAGSWAAPEIKVVTQQQVLGSSPATFHPDAALTQSALATAISAANAIQHPPLPPQPAPQPIEVTSTVGPETTIGGTETWVVDAPGQQVSAVDFAVDGIGRVTHAFGPFEYELATTPLTDGQHQLAANVHFANGGYAIAVWDVIVDNSSGQTYVPGAPIDVPVVKSKVPAPPLVPQQDVSIAVLYNAASPATAVTMKQLDAALVNYLGLGKAAWQIQQALKAAGLDPPPSTGDEAVARMLGLRLDHPAAEDYLESLPNAPITRAEAAWSFAHVLHLDDWARQYVSQAAAGFSLPSFTPWQQRILTTAVHYVGYPYVWGGTSPTHEIEFGVPSVGGFDCSGFVWRAYKLTAYRGENGLASVLRGRTTYQMSGEVPRSQLISIAKLQPADVMFFGHKGPRSSPSIVDHTALYLGNGWFIQSSGQGVTLLPLDGWYRSYFAWARRPLREAGLE
jgi:cell wall-associated NlpC family hydrolase